MATRSCGSRGPRTRRIAFRAEVLPIPKTLEHATASGEIGDAAPSLFQSIEAAGEGAELAIVMAEVPGFGRMDQSTATQAVT